MIRRPPRSTLSSSSAASDVYKRQVHNVLSDPSTLLNMRSEVHVEDLYLSLLHHPLSPWPELKELLLQALFHEDPEPMLRVLEVLPALGEENLARLVQAGLLRIKSHPECTIVQLANSLKQGVLVHPVILPKAVMPCWIQFLECGNLGDDEDLFAVLGLLAALPPAHSMLEGYLHCTHSAKLLCNLLKRCEKEPTSDTAHRLVQWGKHVVVNVTAQKKPALFGVTLQALLEQTSSGETEVSQKQLVFESLLNSTQAAQGWRSELVCDDGRRLGVNGTKDTEGDTDHTTRVIHLVATCMQILDKTPEPKLFAKELVARVYHHIAGECCSLEPTWEQHSEAASKLGGRGQNTILDWDRAIQLRLEKNPSALPLLLFVAGLPDSSELLTPCVPILSSVLVNLISFFDAGINYNGDGITDLALTKLTNAEAICKILGDAGWLATALSRSHMAFVHISGKEVAQILRLVWRYFHNHINNKHGSSSESDQSYLMPLRLIVHRHIEQLGEYYGYFQLHGPLHGPPK
eukprot:TRINITY_DN38846_c0_g1_i2.p1 TRINITY_DN38846_c0_g1~~TRINITY_DN38846_c0_g1_i2.p1  ORF type:complete len:519 (-),score=140.77 TRINITY_DN38846_c0_g1_i2:98-1654(-)